MYWRFRTHSMFESIREQVYRKVYFDEFFDMNHEWVPTGFDYVKHKHLLSLPALVHMYEKGDIACLKTAMALHLQLQQHIFDLAHQTPSPMLQFRKTDDDLGTVRLIF